MKREDLTYEQEIKIYNSEIGELEYMFEVFNQNGYFQEKVGQHPAYKKALPLVDKNAIWKDLMVDAELDVSVDMAFKIYEIVKGVIE